MMAFQNNFVISQAEIETMSKKFEIRNSTAEFLTFVAEGKEQGIQVLYKNETVWATQRAMAILFDCSTDNIGLHLKNIYDTKELDKEATTEKISVVQQEGTREVQRNTLFYNLDAVISDAGTVSAEYAKMFAESEFEKYRVIQDRLFQSDFDKILFFTK